MWVALGSRGIGSRVELSPGRYHAGDFIDEEVTVYNRSRLPKLLLQAQENTNLPGHINAAAFNLPPGGSYRWNTKVHCSQRGKYSLGALTVAASDPFGLFYRQVNLATPQEIMVYPAIFELPFFDPLASDANGYGNRRQLAAQMSTNVATVREYATGDNLKNLHWASTAHMGKLMVKLFDPEHSRHTARNVWVVLDMHEPAQSGQGEHSTEEYAVTIAASLVQKYTDTGCPVGFMASADVEAQIFTPGEGSEHLEEIMSALAVMKAKGRVSVEQLITSEAGRFGSDSMVILITPSNHERLAASVHQLTRRGVLVAVILVDSESFGGTGGLRSAANLMSIGAQVYPVRRGDDLAAALNSGRPLR